MRGRRHPTLFQEKETWYGAVDMVTGAIGGFLGGWLVAAVVDSAALAYKPATAKPLALSVTPPYLVLGDMDNRSIQEVCPESRPSMPRTAFERSIAGNVSAVS